MNEVLAVLLKRHRPDNEALSALLDGRLADRERDALEAHVASCDACRARLDALHRTRDALRSLPQLDAPRSFRLRAADVATSVPVHRAPVAARAMPLLAAAAALVFIVVLEADLAGGSSTGSSQMSGLRAMSAATSGPPTAAGAGVGQIGAADSAAPTPSDNALPEISPGYAQVSPAAGSSENASDGAGAPVAPDVSGSPQPALGTESGAAPPAPAAPSDAPAPIASTEQPPQAKSAATEAAPASGGAGEMLAPTSPSENTSASRSSGGSTGRSEILYRILEGVAAATAIAASAGTLAWWMKNRRVGP
jgi:hypothetical protein